jgi:hypothetical protein
VLVGVALDQPDLELGLRAELFAPRLARQAVRVLDNPSPDLRDAVLLLVSNLVTRACRTAGDPSARIDLRAWMPALLVRVEVIAVGELFPEGDGHSGEPDFDRDLLHGLTDRWGIEREEDTTLVWFEIDRVRLPQAGSPAPGR